jgi:putative ATPase
MRPRTLDEFVGQDEIVGQGKLLRRAILADRLGSVILYGPPGTGKTTLARVIANTTKAQFEQLNAVTSGVTDLRRVFDEARARLGETGQKTILFVDEIHRFNKSQQDALLPVVEQGDLTFVGATTENPYVSVNPPLVSRARVFRLEPLRSQDIEKLLRRALTDTERGLGQYRVDMDEDALAHLVDVCGGDARSALSALELAVLTTVPGEDGLIHVTLSAAEDSIQRRVLRYDRAGTEHYDTVSAFIKSMRGSDPDAALFWLARMLEAGEDPVFVARRIVICAAEDVGNADPRALMVAVAAAQAADMLGMPEARIPLAEAVTYIACAPKGNAAYLGVDAALEDVRSMQQAPVPAHLRDHSYDRGRLPTGKGYAYPHDFPGHYTPQQYLPDGLIDRQYYNPGENGHEADQAAYLGRTKRNAQHGR